MYDLKYMDYFMSSPFLTKLDLLELHIYLGRKDNRYVEDLIAIYNGRYLPDT